MAKGKRPHVHCKKYLTEKRRVKNKTVKLEKRIKNIKPEIQETIKRNSRIGREKEGFKQENFKHRQQKRSINNG